ncbi:stage III sporulation protein AD [Terrilactibacillus sp. BCM23-1]|uniref:Stage III sporulation protein AD n=1 Tax=Terrilactibacillus tamarindi TaxID=2599694 RepID=A0A6N8CR12_9BACI|nr:stage III sporulation protein AD [Terrilactibacillus tamarindi]MTT32679.1 stage III sporulation protein AD [Terrilactibacillus tamarindi]
MTIDILQIVGLGLVATFIVLILKEQKPSLAFLLSIFVGALIFLYLIDQIKLVMDMLIEIASSAHLNNVYVETILKIIGIAYIAEFGAQITRDAGEGALASKIELAGKVLILVLAIPIMKAVIQTIIGLISQ